MSKAHQMQKHRATPFTCRAPSAQAVFLAGTFNGWKPNATPMNKDGKGEWSVSLKLPLGRHEFKFVVDGQWCCEPGCDGPHHGCTKCVHNPFGTMNRVIEVS